MRRLVFIVLAVFIAIVFACGCKKTDVERSVYTISATFDGRDTVVADMTLDYFNETQTEITELYFNLYPNAFREGARFKPTTVHNEASAYPHGKSYGWMEIEGCMSEGEPTPFRIEGEDENILVLCLKKGVFPAERTVVGIKFTVKIAECRLRLGHFNGTVNLANWYPVLCYRNVSGVYQRPYSAIGDPFCSEVADYFVDITLPGEFSVASGADCVETMVDELLTTYSYESLCVRDIAFSFSKEFEVIARKTGDIDIFFYHRGCEYAESAARVAELAVSTFSELFGDYPYSTFTAVSTPFVQGGMEYPRIVYLSDMLEEDELITATVHETAHQWWYGVVGNNQYEHAFLDEGLAEYSTLLFFEKHPGFGRERGDIINAKSAEYRAFCGVYEQLNGKVDTSMSRSLDGFCGEYDYVQTAYTRSLLMLDGFRDGVGEARFLKGLRRFYKDNAYSVVGPESLISAFRTVGCDAEGYFNSWIDGRAVV